jgi:hypothetical protein
MIAGREKGGWSSQLLRRILTGMFEESGAAPGADAPVAIFVRVDDASLSDDPMYGNVVKRAMLAAVLGVDRTRSCRFQTHWGSLILPALRLASSSSGLRGGTTLAHDPFLLWSSANDLCRSGGRRWHTLGSHTPWLLGTANIYLGVISKLPTELRSLLDQQLRSYPWYIGAMGVQREDPLHQQVFSLIPGWRYCQGWVDQPNEIGISAAELFADVAVDGVGLDDHPLLEQECSIGWEPAIAVSETQVTLASLGSRSGTTYQESIAVLVDQFEGAARPASFAVGRQQPRVEDLRGKLFGYALNFDHDTGQDKGKDKARVFKAALGIEQQHWKLLAIQLISALQAAELQRFRNDPKVEHGQQQRLAFHISAPVIGLNGTTKLVRAAWQIQDDGPVALVTAYVEEKTAEFPEVPAAGTGDWPALHSIAVTVAGRAMQECRPTPFAVGGPEDVEVLAEGMMGSAWVRFPDARTGFVRWLLRNGHATRCYPGAQISAPSFYAESASAWAEAAAAVFQAAEHPCFVVELLD